MSAAPNIARALAAGADRLAGAGIADARAEARLLLRTALGTGPETLVAHPERPLETRERGDYEALLARRARREPMAQILGRREFWSLDLHVTADTLDPRPDSETVIEALLGTIADREAPWRLLDLGTGSGCLLLAALRELPNATGVGIDISEASIAVARRNADSVGVAGRAAFAVSDWASGVAGPFDRILANPPYIASAEIAGLAPEIAAYEPRIALDGGGDGLDAYRALAPEIARLLAIDGTALIEIGADQAAKVAGIVAAAGLDPVSTRRDLGARPRCLEICFAQG